jgi:hypothetical protein
MRRELNQPRCPRGVDDLAERVWTRLGFARPQQVLLIVGDVGAAKISMIPQVEEVRGEAQILPLRELEVPNQREIPFPLERSVMQIARLFGRFLGAASAFVSLSRPPREALEPPRFPLMLVTQSP